MKDTNQASEAELRDKIADVFDDLLEPTNKFWHRDSALHQADKIMKLVRTEKLKLLAEVKERVVGSLEPQSENGLLPDRVDRRNQLRTEQLEVLTTQAQERRDLINQRNQYDDQTISGANNICGTITLHRRLGRQ